MVPSPYLCSKIAPLKIVKSHAGTSSCPLPCHSGHEALKQEPPCLPRRKGWERPGEARRGRQGGLDDDPWAMQGKLLGHAAKSQSHFCAWRDACWGVDKYCPSIALIPQMPPRGPNSPQWARPRTKHHTAGVPEAHVHRAHGTVEVPARYMYSRSLRIGTLAKLKYWNLALLQTKPPRLHHDPIGKWTTGGEPTVRNLATRTITSHSSLNLRQVVGTERTID